MLVKILTLSIALMCLSVSGELANELKLCKYGDYECIKATIETLFKEKSQGFDLINLPKLYPLKYEKIHLHQSSGSAVSLDMVMKNQSIYGLETAKVLKVKGFGKDLTMRHSLKLHATYLSSVGDYDVNGKILILPIIGSGIMNITFVEIDLFLSFVGKPLEKDGATYMDIENFSFEAKPNGTIFKVDNLFNGDKVLGENMNLFLNQNWEEIIQEVHDSLTKGFGAVFQEVIKSVFRKYPYDKYFTD